MNGANRRRIGGDPMTYLCQWCETPTDSRTAAGWPICDTCWNEGEDGWSPPTLEVRAA